MFWATHLLCWNAVGQRMFLETRPVQVTITGDARPSGWGAQTVDGSSTQETYDQFSDTEAAAG
eukprot:COSAG01_NODE_23457_length_814_cov_2.386014_1_plen_63_part_00